MKKNILLTILIFVSFLLFTQLLTAQESVPLIANWEVGDAYRFEITKVDKYSNRFNTDWNHSVKYISDFEVLKKDDNGYTVKWIRHTNFDFLHIPEHLIPEFAEYATFEAIYKTDLKGSFGGVENWKELKKKKSKLYDEGLKILKKEKKKVKNAFIDAYRMDSEYFGTAETVNKIIFSELWHLHYLYGLEYPVHEKIEFQIEDKIFPNCDAVTMNVGLYVSDANDTNFTISKEVLVDEESKVPFLKDVFSFARTAPPYYNNIMKTARLDFEEKIIYQFDHKDAIPNKFDVSEKILIRAEGGDHSNSFQEVRLRRLD